MAGRFFLGLDLIEILQSIYVEFKFFVYGILMNLAIYLLGCVVPDLETVKFKVLSRRGQYEIREVEVNKYNCL